MKTPTIAMLIIAALSIYSANLSAQTATNNASSENTRAMNLIERDRLAFALAPIKSSADLHRYVKMTALKSSPLRYLTPAARQKFLNSLTFNAKGVSGFRIVELESNLSATQIEEVLALFGAQRVVALLPNAKATTLRDKELLAKSAVKSNEDMASPSAICADCWANDPGEDGSWGGGGGNPPPPPPPPPNPYPPRDYPGMVCSQMQEHTCVLAGGAVCLRTC